MTSIWRGPGRGLANELAFAGALFDGFRPAVEIRRLHSLRIWMDQHTTSKVSITFIFTRGALWMFLFPSSRQTFDGVTRIEGILLHPGLECLVIKLGIRGRGGNRSGYRCRRGGGLLNSFKPTHYVGQHEGRDGARRYNRCGCCCD